MNNQWFINKQSQIEHRVTRETTEVGYNGELYDVTIQQDRADFSVLLRNIVVAGELSQAIKLKYGPDTRMQPGEEIVLRYKDISIELLDYMRRLLEIPDLRTQLAIANRS